MVVIEEPEAEGDATAETMPPVPAVSQPPLSFCTVPFPTEAAEVQDGDARNEKVSAPGLLCGKHRFLYSL